jgi:2-haloacid dehalogenase
MKRETMRNRLDDFEVLSFDCYGTLIDWETGIWDALQPLYMANRGRGPERGLALARFAEHEDRIEQEQPASPYPAVLEQVHAALAEQSGLQSNPSLDRDFGQSVGLWPAFSDTAEALRLLQGKYRLVILSNVDRESFALSNRKLGVTFDAVYTAGDIGSYKPSPANFRYLLRQLKTDLRVAPDRVLHTAQSLYHDLAPARECGLATAWIDRQKLSDGGKWGATKALAQRPEVDFLYFSLAELAAAATGSNA